MAPAPERTRVFLSYGRADAADLAGRLRAGLEARGDDVWQDTGRARAGQAWARAIRDALADARAFVALLSPHAVRDGGVCANELQQALDNRLPIVPVMALPCPRPLLINDLHYLDAT